MSNTWKQWEGQTIQGKFPLLRYLGGSESCAVFLTERGEGESATKAAIKLVPVALENGELQLSRWRQASELSHPNLIPLYEMGRFELRGVPLVFVVMECAEENLAQILPDRALAPDEAREVLNSLVDVLAYLHSKGFVHGHIKPANIMASEDKLKVASDGLRRAGEPIDAPRYQTAYDAPENARGILPISQLTSPAADVWSLGVTLVEMLTQKHPVARTAEQMDPLIPQALPEPFSDIAVHCLRRHPEARWSVAQIAARLSGQASIPEPKAAVPADVRVPEPAPKPMAAPRRATPPARRSGYATPIVVGLAIVFGAIFVRPKLWHRHSDTAQVSAVMADQPAAAPVAREVTPPQQEQSDPAPESHFAEDEPSAKASVPVPALIRPETLREETSDTAARLPMGSIARGQVVHQDMPEVLKSATNSIRGTVRVRVKVNVDRSGNVEDAELESRGPSKYFSRVAVDAAQNWKFEPPKIGGKGVLSSWTLQFEFTRDNTMVVPTQDLP